MNIVFMGTPQFAVPIAKMVHETYGIDLIVSQPDKVQGRKKTMVSPPLKEFAVEHNIPCIQPQRIHDSVNDILAKAPDLIITAAYGQILPEKLLVKPTYGAINVHGSLLPKLRGGAPIQRAIERGEDYTGITIMYMAKRMDAGDIIATKRIRIEGDETAATLFEKLSQLGSDLLEEVLPSIFNNEVKATPQNEEEVTYAYNIRREEERLDFYDSAEVLERKIRAFYPEPNTYFTVNDTAIKVIEAEVVEINEPIEPGQVYAHDKTGIIIQCKEKGLKLTKVKPAGKKAMGGAAFLNGQGKTLLPIGKKIT